MRLLEVERYLITVNTGSEKRRKEKAEVQLPNTVEEERKKKRKSWFYLNDRDNNL